MKCQREKKRSGIEFALFYGKKTSKKGQEKIIETLKLRDRARSKRTPKAAKYTHLEGPWLKKLDRRIPSKWELKPKKSGFILGEEDRRRGDDWLQESRLE